MFHLGRAIINFAVCKNYNTLNILLTDWFAQNKVNETEMFITVAFLVHSITDELQPFQSGNVFNGLATLTGARYKHRSLFKVYGLILIRINSIQFKPKPVLQYY